MTQSKYRKPLNDFNAPPGLAKWKAVEDAEHGELYAFTEDLTFSRPAKDKPTALANNALYQKHLELIGTAAVLGIKALTDLPDQVTVHLNDENNFVHDAMAHIGGILQGEAFYLPYMRAMAPNDTFGTHFISVRVEGVIVRTEHGASVYFNVKVLAVEANARTGQFTIVQIIEKEDAPVHALNTAIQPSQGGTISTTLNDHHDAPPLNANVSFLPTEPVPGDDSTR